LAPRTIVLADKAYDTKAIRDLIEVQGAVPKIPSKANRRWQSCFSRRLYKGRNAVERMFCRLKDYRRILGATTSSTPASLGPYASQPSSLGGCERWA
jgi:transposase